MDAQAPIQKDRDQRTDLELVAAINGGDAAAFEVLYLRYRDWVVGLAHRFTGDSNSSLDILQETFLYLLKKFPGFRLSANMKTFLYPAVRNLSIAARKKAARYQSGELGASQIEEIPACDTVPGSSGEVGAILAMLGPEHREVLLLRFVDDLTLAEIAQALGIPLGTVKSRLHHALERLRAHPRTRGLFNP